MMTVTVDKKNRDKSDKIRKAVKLRVKQESVKYPIAIDKKEVDQVTPAYIDQCLNSGELGDATLYATCNRDKFIFNLGTGVWLDFTGHFWECDTTNRSLAVFEKTVVKHYITGLVEIERTISACEAAQNYKDVPGLEAKAREYRKRIKKLRTHRARITVREMSTTIEVPLAVKGSVFDLSPWLLVCKNGVIDLRSGKFRDGRPDEFMFLASPTEWKGLDEPCERWEKFLLEIFEEHAEMVAYVQRLLGYGASGFNVDHVFPIFWGRGRNGKSKLVEALTYVLGPLAGAIQPELLLDQRRPRSSQGPSSDILALKGLRMAFASETDEGQSFSTGRVKMFTGGDQLVGRYPYEKEETRFMPTHKLFMLTNNRPRADGADYAFWSRLHLIPFRVSFVLRETGDEFNDFECPADKYLGEKLKKEASGILAWLVKGFLAYQKEGLKPPKDITTSTEEYRRDQDLLADFLDSQCLDGTSEETGSKQLYDRFLAWFRVYVSATAKFSHARFGILMSKKYEKKTKNGRKFYIGIKLGDNTIEEDDKEK